MAEEADHVRDLARIDADRQQTVARRMQEVAPALPGHRLVEAGIEDYRALLADDRSHEVIERHRHLVRVAAIEILARQAVMVCIAHGVDLVAVPVIAPSFSRPGDGRAYRIGVTDRSPTRT